MRREIMKNSAQERNLGKSELSNTNKDPLNNQKEKKNERVI